MGFPRNVDAVSLLRGTPHNLNTLRISASSRLSLRFSACSALDVPGDGPASIWALRLHRRTDPVREFLTGSFALTDPLPQAFSVMGRWWGTAGPHAQLGG